MDRSSRQSIVVMLDDLGERQDSRAAPASRPRRKRRTTIVETGSRGAKIHAGGSLVLLKLATRNTVRRLSPKPWTKASLFTFPRVSRSRSVLWYVRMWALTPCPHRERLERTAETDDDAVEKSSVDASTRSQRHAFRCLPRQIRKTKLRHVNCQSSRRAGAAALESLIAMRVGAVQAQQHSWIGETATTTSHSYQHDES